MVAVGTAHTRVFVLLVRIGENCCGSQDFYACGAKCCSAHYGDVHAYSSRE